MPFTPELYPFIELFFYIVGGFAAICFGTIITDNLF